MTVQVNSGLSGGLVVSCIPVVGCSWSVRHIKTAKRTTIRLENSFWQAIDVVATKLGLTWRQWVENILSAKPVGANSASWLRVNCLLMLKES